MEVLRGGSAENNQQSGILSDWENGYFSVEGKF
jgi:hypothetical protein